MTQLDIERLIKVLGMTGSVHDGEALAALRTAIKMMAAAKVSWADLLKPAIKVEPKMNHRSDAYAYANSYSHQRTPEEAAMQQEMLRRYAEDMQRRQNQHRPYEPSYSDDLYEAIFGRKRR